MKPSEFKFKKLISKFILILMVFDPFSFASVSGENSAFNLAEQKVKIYSDTQLRLPQGGILKIQNELPIGRLNDFISETQNLSMKDNSSGELLFPSKEQIVEVNIVVPKGISIEEQELFVSAIRKQLENQFEKGLKFKIKKVKVDINEIDSFGTNLLTDSNSGNNLKENQNTRELLKFHKKIINKLKDWKNNFKKTINKIRSNREVQLGVAGSMIGFGKSTGGIKYWLSTTGFNAFGVSQIALSLMLDQIFSAWAQRINDWKSNHSIPIFKEQKLIEMYNNNPIIKAFIINQLIGFSSNFTFRLLSYLNDPQNVGAPWSTEFLSIFGGMALAGTVVGSLGDVAPNKLLKNNRIPAGLEWLIYQGYGITFMLNGLLFASGNIDLLPYSLALEWLPKVALSGLSYGLKAKDNHITVIHDSIKGNGLKSIKYSMGLKEESGGAKRVFNVEELLQNEALYKLADKRGFGEKLFNDGKKLRSTVSKKLRSLNPATLCKRFFSGVRSE